MVEPRFVAGDWGTTSLRLFLCDAEGAIVGEAGGSGAAGAQGQFANILEHLTSSWRRQWGALPTVLCGMVGSNIGWVEVPYLPTPANAEDIVEACVALPSGVHIVPGLSCRNRFDAPDYMRGEETQILGALRLEPALQRGVRLLCLPGTHTKWALLEEGTVREFFSAPTGEVFAALRDHSVLVRNRSGGDGDLAAFGVGLAQFNAHPRAQLLHRLFECRARQLSGEFSARVAENFMSGLLIASDVQGALELLSGIGVEGSVCVVGSAALAQRYRAALSANGRESQALDGSLAALAGLTQVYRRLRAGVAA